MSAGARDLVWRAGASLISVLLLGSCTMHRDDETADYERIGAVGSDVLFAKVAHETDGDYLDVLLRDEHGENLCDGRGPLMLDQQMPAVCNEQYPGEYVYVGQQSKRGAAAPLCREDGQAVSPTRLATNSSWAADFVVEVDRSGSDLSFISFCGPMIVD